MKKITYNGQMRNEHFLIVMHHSSLAKAAVNGLRICKLRNCKLRICKLRNGVKKTPQFLLFSMEKGEPSAQ
jgi:hypothetical protein